MTGLTPARKRRPHYWFFSRARFFVRRHGVATAHLANLLWLAGRPVGRLLSVLRGRKTNDPPHFWRDFLMTYYGPRGLMYQPRALTADSPAA